MIKLRLDMEIGTTRNIKNSDVEMILRYIFVSLCTPFLYCFYLFITYREGGGKVVAQKGTKTLAGSCTNQLRVCYFIC
jgi:hypothetical protein